MQENASRHRPDGDYFHDKTVSCLNSYQNADPPGGQNRDGNPGHNVPPQGPVLDSQKKHDKTTNCSQYHRIIAGYERDALAQAARLLVLLRAPQVHHLYLAAQLLRHKLRHCRALARNFAQTSA